MDALHGKGIQKSGAPLTSELLRSHVKEPHILFSLFAPHQRRFISIETQAYQTCTGLPDVVSNIGDGDSLELTTIPISLQTKSSASDWRSLKMRCSQTMPATFMNMQMRSLGYYHTVAIITFDQHTRPSNFREMCCN